ncbi:MAG: PAS domain S-box protein [Anaerolineae bacterium]|nr:PAS domain S-box protein [Anaerolineae bacterium]
MMNETPQTQLNSTLEDASVLQQNDQLMRVARCAIVTLDAECRFLQTSASIQALTGYEPSDLIGTSYYDLIADDWREKVQSTGCISPDGEEIQQEFPLQMTDGKLCWVRHSAVQLQQAGEIRYQCMIQDITASKQTDVALQRTQRRNQALLDALPDMMIVVTRGGQLTGFHISPESDSLSVSRKVAAQQQNIHSLGLPEVITDELMMHLDMALDVGRVQTFEFQMPNQTSTGKDDLRDFFEARLSAVNEDEALVLIRNVTPLKKIQQELRQHNEILHTVSEFGMELSGKLSDRYVAMHAVDAAVRLTNANEGFLATVHGEPEILYMMGSYDEREVLSALRNPTGVIARVLETQKTELISNVETEPGYQRFVPHAKSLLMVPLHGRDELIGLLYLEARSSDRFNEERMATLHLITDRIEAFLENARLYRQKNEELEERRRLYEEVRQLEQLKTDMIRIASHDLKNPLAAILGYVEMLTWDGDENFSQTQLEYLNNIETAAKKMQRITSSILSLERIKQMAQQTSSERIDVAELVRRTVSEQMDFAVRFKHVINRNVPDAPIAISGDAIQLHEALSNIINNAIKYTPQQGQIDVSVTVKDTTVQVRVKDSGFGIPEDKQARLFSPFYRATTEETREIEGTGLGLHLVKNIIERHNGTMFFHSVYGEGSTFGFDLPILLG